MFEWTVEGICETTMAWRAGTKRKAFFAEERLPDTDSLINRVKSAV
jgi:hypothetical protein